MLVCSGICHCVAEDLTQASVGSAEYWNYYPSLSYRVLFKIEIIKDSAYKTLNSKHLTNAWLLC